MTPLGQLRRSAAEWARDGISEAVIVERLIERLADEPDAARDAHLEWARHLAADAVSAAVQPSGRTSRAPAVLDFLQERMPWANLPPQIGYDEMHGYVRRFDGVFDGVSLYRRILAVLDPVWATRSLATCPTFGEACRVAGVDMSDVEALAA